MFWRSRVAAARRGRGAARRAQGARRLGGRDCKVGNERCDVCASVMAHLRLKVEVVKSHDRERMLRLAIKRNEETVDAKINEYKHRVVDSQLTVFRLTDSERFLEEKVEELQARLAERDAKFDLERQALESQSEVRISGVHAIYYGGGGCWGNNIK